MPPSRRVLIAAVVVALLAGATLAWFGLGARSQAAPEVREQGRALLDAVARQVRTTFIRSVPEAQLYAGATKTLLETAGPVCAKLVGEVGSAGPGRARFFAVFERVEARCPTAARNPASLYLAAARGMLDALGDQYTRLMEPEAFRMFLQDTQGFFFGIGIYIDVRDGVPIVVQPIAETPAARAGLRAGDRIIMVDGVSTRNMALQEAVTRIRGREGTTVRLRMRRGDEEFDVGIVRARIRIVAAEGPERLDSATRAELRRAGIGYVRLVTFNHEQAAAEFGRFVDQARRSGARALIVDLRNNGGGLLDQSIQIASRFLGAGAPVLHTTDRTGRRDTQRARQAPRITLPTVVLVNEFSASASEIMAGALQDSGTATVVGVRTFGKNLIQSIVDLPMNAGAAITSAKWLTPNGQDIGGKGLTPDEVVGEPEEALREGLKGQPEAEVDRRVEQMKADQLKRAVEILVKRLQRSATLRPAA